jgi:DNA-binding NtrC family response regulator
MARILVIDDEDDIREDLRMALERQRHEVVEAIDGKFGLDEYQKGVFDLVITDLIMPRMEGVEIILALKKLNPDVKIIAISAGGMGKANDYLSMVKRLGAKQTLRKPFSRTEFLTAVQQELEPAASGTP